MEKGFDLNYDPQAHVAIHALMAFLYNNNGADVLTLVYGQNIHHSYLLEKLELFDRSIPAWFGSLDHKMQCRLTELVMDRHGEDADRRVVLGEQTT